MLVASLYSFIGKVNYLLVLLAQLLLECPAFDLNAKDPLIELTALPFLGRINLHLCLGQLLAQDRILGPESDSLRLNVLQAGKVAITL